MEEMTQNCKGNSLGVRITKISFPSVVYILSRERNSRVHGRQSRIVVVVLKESLFEFMSGIDSINIPQSRENCMLLESWINALFS